MEYQINVFDTHREYKTFLRQYQNIKQQFINNTIQCFLKDAYDSGSSKFKKTYTYANFLKLIMKEYVLYLPSKRLKQISIKNGLNYMCKVFFHQDDKLLLFSCSLEVSSKHVEIHDVCMGPQEAGKGRCKEFIQAVCTYIQQTFPHHKVKIVCEKKNIPACKCYERVFGNHKRESKDLFKFQM